MPAIPALRGLQQFSPPSTVATRCWKVFSTATQRQWPPERPVESSRPRLYSLGGNFMSCPLKLTSQPWSLNLECDLGLRVDLRSFAQVPEGVGVDVGARGGLSRVRKVSSGHSLDQLGTDRVVDYVARRSLSWNFAHFMSGPAMSWKTQRCLSRQRLD